MNAPLSCNVFIVLCGMITMMAKHTHRNHAQKHMAAAGLHMMQWRS